MADNDNLSDQKFDNIIDELVCERELGLGDDNQSDISTDQWRWWHSFKDDFQPNGKFPPKITIK